MRAEVGDRRRPLGRLASARPHAKLSTVNGCCTPSGYDELFGAKQAQKDARRYRKKGLHAPARWIVDSVRSRGIELDCRAVGQLLLATDGYRAAPEFAHSGTQPALREAQREACRRHENALKTELQRVDPIAGQGWERTPRSGEPEVTLARVRTARRKLDVG